MGSIYVIYSWQCPNGDGIYTLLNALYKCSTSITNQPTTKWGPYIILKAMNAAKWLWPIFGCKVSQNVPLELDLCHHLLHVYTKFQIYISKHAEKMPGKLQKIQNTQK